jgi:hypothetical protein
MLLKAFRLFVSSTFADFAAERDVLQRDVFPTLDAYCAAKGYQFYPLDLRWGINEEAQLDQRTAEICLNEVRAAKQDYPPPNFLILIGDRYGFVPLPYAIAQDEFEGILGWLESRGRQDAANALRAVYQYDSNYLAPFGLSDVRPDGDGLAGAYTLRSRVDEVPELRPTDAWAQREAELRAVLQEAADGLLALGRIGTAAHEKYFLSLTDQEIIYGLPGYRPDFADAASSSSPAADGPAAIAFLREIASEPGATPPALSQYFQPSPHLQALKNGIRRALPPDHVVTAEAIADVNGRFSQTYLADFAARIQGKLTQAIDQYIARVEAIQHAADYALTSERDAHRAFAAKKREIFVGREETLAAIRQYLTVPLGRPLVLHGRSGLGKSALLACAFADAGAAVSAPIVARFVGATGASSNVRALLVSVIEDLAAQGVVKKPVEFEPDINKFNAQIEKLLASITSPAIVFLDALDQLQKPRDLWWLPAKLPEKVKLVISVLDDAAYAAESDLYRSLRERLPPDAFLQLGPLGKSQGRETLLALERQSRRRLQDGQRDYILERFEQASGSPLYLRTAFEIARSWKSYYRAGAGHCLLADDTDGLIAQFIGELSSVQHHEPALVTRTLGYLAAAKNGLSAKELTETLSRDAGVMRAISSEQFGARTDKLPPSLWVRLNRDLSPFLVEKQIDEQPLLQFFHRQVAAVARARHYEAVKTALHVALAAYFESQATAKEGRRIYAKRSLSELPYQLQHADSTARLGEILMSPDWMQQKLNAFGPRPLIDDYQYARTRAQIVTGQALELVAGLLARDPRQLVAQILGRLTARLVDDAAEAAAIDSFLENARALVTAPALVPRWPSFTAPAGAEIRRFEERESQVNAVAFSPDGRRIVSGAGTWYDKDHTVRLWEIASGREIECLRGHSGPVTSVAFSPDQRQIASGSSDRTVRLWEVASGQSRCLQGHTDAVAAVAFSPRGQHIVSASRDKTLRLWETASGNEIRRFEGHTEPVAGAAFSPDGRTVVSGSEDNTLRLWEAASGREIRRFDGHTGRVVAVAFSPDGRNIVSGSWDHTLRVWQVESGQSRLFEGHTAPVKAVVFSADGRSVVSGSTDKQCESGMSRTDNLAASRVISALSLASPSPPTAAISSPHQTIRRCGSGMRMNSPTHWNVTLRG